MDKKNTSALGKGLEALLGNIEKSPVVQTKLATSVNAEIALIKLEDIETNPDQPRREFNEKAMQELAQSIKQHGVIVPITVNKRGNRYQIIAGERRFRASKMAGLDKIPAYIRVVTEQTSMQMALIENIQREDLNAIEIALSLKALLDVTKLTTQQLSERLGKSRSSVSNYIRLLNLPAEVQLALRNDEISMGHARSLITLDCQEKQIDIVRQIIAKGLSVRQVENIVKQLKEPVNKPVKTKKQKNSLLPESHQTFKDSLSSLLDTEINIKRSQRGKGSITINFKNDDDFARIIALLKKNN